MQKCKLIAKNNKWKIDSKREQLNNNLFIYFIKFIIQIFNIINYDIRLLHIYLRVFKIWINIIFYDWIILLNILYYE